MFFLLPLVDETDVGNERGGEGVTYLPTQWMCRVLRTSPAKPLLGTEFDHTCESPGAGAGEQRSIIALSVEELE